MKHKRPRRIGRGTGNIIKRASDLLHNAKFVHHAASALHSAGIGGKYNHLLGNLAAGSVGSGRKHRKRVRKNHSMSTIEHKLKSHLSKMSGHGRRRMHRKRVGKGIWDTVKKYKLISRGAKALGWLGVPGANVASTLAGWAGYGKHKKIHHRRGRGYSPQTGVGIAGQTVYSSGRVIF